MRINKLFIFLIFTLYIIPCLAQPNCDKARNFTHPNGQAKAFGADFYLKKCQCVDQGVLNKEDEKQLIAMMKYDRQNFIDYGGSSSVLGTIPTSCKMNIDGSADADGGNDKFSIYEDDLINDDVQSLIHEWAANSDDPHLKTLSKELQGFEQVNQDVNFFRSTFNITPSQANLQFDQTLTNAAQLVSIGKFIVNSINEKNKLSTDQKNVFNELLNRRESLKTSYIKMSNNHDSRISKMNTIHELDKLKREYYAYDLITATERLLIVKYFWDEKYFTSAEIKNIYTDISSMQKIDIIKEIDQWSSDYNNTSIFKNIALNNADVLFNVELNEIKIKTANIYRKNNQIDKAKEILKTVDYNLSSIEAYEMMSSAVSRNNYEQALLIYPILKQQIKQDTQAEDVYFQDSGIKGNRTPDRTEVFITLGFGSYSYSIKGDTITSKNELIFLKKILDKKPKDYLITKDYADQAIYKAIQARYYIEIGQIQKAEKLINEAFNLIHLTSNTEYTVWLSFIRFQILSELENYEEAHLLYNEIMSEIGNDNTIYLLKKNELIFAKCEILFKQCEFERVLKGLDMLELREKDKKYNFLRAKVYLAQGKNDAFEQEIEAYNN